MRSLLPCLGSLLLTGCMTLGAERPVDLLGNPAAVGSGERTLVITPNTKHVNVTGGEIIDFKVGEKQFAWHFFVAQDIRSFDLKRVAPPGVLDHSVIAYIKPDPRYCCNGFGRGKR